VVGTGKFVLYENRIRQSAVLTRFVPMKRALKVFGWIGLALLVVGAYAGYRIAFGKPFSINQLANRQAVIVLLQSIRERGDFGR
jgi:hypothetical protein